MNTDTIIPKSAPAIVLCAIAGLVFSLTLSTPAAAWVSGGGWGGGWGGGDYYDHGDWEESQAAAEESSREADRKERRKEVDAEQKQKSAETQDYYASLYQASSASLNAPKGVYYRKPGWTSSDPPPPTSQNVAAGQVFLIYDKGIFWFQRGNDYIVVPPPFGVVVDTLPPGVRAQPSKEGTTYYFFGTFFRGKDGKYVVVKPAPGTLVGYLPDGYTQESSKDTTVFTFANISYKQAFLQGVLVYQVI